MKRKDFIRNVFFGIAAAFVPKIFLSEEDIFSNVIYSLSEETACDKTYFSISGMPIHDLKRYTELYNEKINSKI